MDETSGEDHLEKSKEMLLAAKNAIRLETETPMTQVLSPEAREDALKVAEQIKTKAAELLAEKDRVIRVDPTKAKGNIEIMSKKGLEGTIFEGAELGASRYTFKNHPDGSQDSIQELWHLFPDHAMKTIRNESESGSGRVLAPKGLAIEKIEADRDELGALLADIEASAPYVPPTYP